MRKIRRLMVMILAILVTVPTSAALAEKKERDICIGPVGSSNTNFVFRDVNPLAPSEVISLHGVWFTGTTGRLVAPFHGSAVMTPDGTVRMGIFVHGVSTADGVTSADFTVSTHTDTDFLGVWRSGGIPFAVELRDCDAITIPTIP